MSLTDFIESMFLPVFKKAEAEGDMDECKRLLEVLKDAIIAAIRQTGR